MYRSLPLVGIIIFIDESEILWQSCLQVICLMFYLNPCHKFVLIHQEIQYPKILEAFLGILYRYFFSEILSLGSLLGEWIEELILISSISVPFGYPYHKHPHQKPPLSGRFDCHRKKDTVVCCMLSTFRRS